MKRRGRHDAHGNAALFAARSTTCRFKCPIILRDSRARSIEENTSGLGQLNATRLAAKKLNAELGFDRFYTLAEWWLLHAEPLGSPRNVPFLGDGHELTEVSQLHSYIVFNMNFGRSIQYLPFH